MIHRHQRYLLQFLTFSVRNIRRVSWVPSDRVWSVVEDYMNNPNEVWWRWTTKLFAACSRTILRLYLTNKGKKIEYFKCSNFEILPIKEDKSSRNAEASSRTSAIASFAASPPRCKFAMNSSISLVCCNVDRNSVVIAHFQNLIDGFYRLHKSIIIDVSYTIDLTESGVLWLHPFLSLSFFLLLHVISPSTSTKYYSLHTFLSSLYSQIHLRSWRFPSRMKEEILTKVSLSDAQWRLDHCNKNVK